MLVLGNKAGKLFQVGAVSLPVFGRRVEVQRLPSLRSCMQESPPALGEPHQCCCPGRQPRRADHWFIGMLEAKVVADRTTYSILISAAAQAGGLEGAEDWFVNTLKARIVPNEKTYDSLINATAHAGNLEKSEYWL